ncbi:MAG: GNAT family N-acetyltransferase [Clostridiales bacterium]|nr:GNAT family N-acetyltransferase [Clostridiales bacterium]
MKFKLMQADETDAVEIVEIMRQSYEQLEHKDWYITDDIPYIRHHLKAGNGIGYKAIEIDSGTMAGFYVASFQWDTPKNLGWKIGFTAAQCRKTAFMDTTAVLPKYRGHRLQYYLMQELEKTLYSMGFRYLTATVHPDNHSSKNTMMYLNYKAVGRIDKCGSPRDIMLKVLDENVTGRV